MKAHIEGSTYKSILERASLADMFACSQLAPSCVFQASDCGSISLTNFDDKVDMPLRYVTRQKLRAQIT